MSTDNWGQPKPAHTNGQFKQGKSGNPRGRPPKKERSYTHRQIRHDVLDLMEREAFKIKINGKMETVPVILGVYWRMIQLALEGDRRMLLEVVKLRQQLIDDHRISNLDTIRALDFHEAKIGESAVAKLDRYAIQFLNGLRKQTREL
jgi:Family of unknown function (DUF5681)